MKTQLRQRAYLYIRVSTDEQAERGYSQKHQDDRLRQYCEYQNIEIIDVYWEDYSAKAFDRPEFRKFLDYVTKHRNTAELLLFLKWDRFSRNIAEAYAMINRLTKLGIEPQAIEQPLDLSIPENKMMLAFYLAAPEVENDRRSLNTIAGMRRAMKEGRHVNKAPRGYKNTRDEYNNPIIIPGKDAPLIKWAFEEMAKGMNNIMEVWKLSKDKGLKVGKSQMWNLLRNPVYCGKIFIPAYKNEDVMIVKAKHEPLVSEVLFNDVQDVLTGRKRKRPVRNTLKEELPLRGFLYCAQCGRKITGSASKGNGGRYFYYHCTKGCPERFRAVDANDQFQNELQKICVNANAIELYHAVLKDYNKLSKEEKEKYQQPIKAEIERCRTRINSARELMLDSQLAPKEYQEIRDEYEKKARNMEKQLTEMAVMDARLKEQLEFCGELLPNLTRYYEAADLRAKQEIIGSIYPEKLIFEKNTLRTARVNEVILWMCRPIAGSGGSKNEESSKILELSTLVARPGFEPRQTEPKSVVLPLYYRAIRPLTWPNST